MSSYMFDGYVFFFDYLYFLTYFDYFNNTLKEMLKLFVTFIQKGFEGKFRKA